MSASTSYITTSAFTVAIQDLPLENVYMKAAELQNSIDHLRHSNEQLRPFSDEQGDVDYREAIEENLQVIERMKTRILALRDEVGRRGSRWILNPLVDDRSDAPDRMDVDGVNGRDPATPPSSEGRDAGAATGPEGGTRTSRVESPTRYTEQAEGEEPDEGGVHL